MKIWLVILLAAIFLAGCEEQPGLVFIETQTNTNSSTVNNFTTVNNITNNISNNYYSTSGTGNGTANVITKWANSTHLTNSLISESGKMITIDGNITIPAFTYGGFTIGNANNLLLGVAPIAIGQGAISNNSYTISMGYGPISAALYGVALGYDAQSKGGTGAVAVGGSTRVNGTGAIGIGYGARANTDYSTAIGISATSQGYRATSIGQAATADGQDGFALGSGAWSRGTYDMAIGYNSYASGSDSFALGQSSKTLGTRSMAIGTGALAGSSDSQAYGYVAYSNYSWSIAMGRQAITNAANQFMLGTTGTGVLNLVTTKYIGVMTTTNPTYPLEVNSTVGSSGISIYAVGNVSADDYITRTDVYNKPTSALNQIKNSTQYLKSGQIDHSSFGYSYINYTVEVQNGSKRVNVTEEGVSLTKEVALLKQALYEAKLRIEALEAAK